MAQIFPPVMNTIARTSIVGGVLLLSGLLVMGFVIYRSPFVTQVDVPKPQAVPFSHKHHVQGLGLDCRYCHTSVETSSFAGLPPTETCMTCHSQVWSDAPILQPVRDSWRDDKPLHWTRVNDLPDFVYFNHSIHINRGVGCATCHGRVDQMPLTWKANTLHMQWCLDCHKAPEKYLRPRDEVFNMEYTPPADQLTLGRQLVKEYGVNVHQLTNCSVCHR